MSCVVVVAASPRRVESRAPRRSRRRWSSSSSSSSWSTCLRLSVACHRWLVETISAKFWFLREPTFPIQKYYNSEARGFVVARARARAISRRQCVFNRRLVFLTIEKKRKEWSPSVAGRREGGNGGAREEDTCSRGKAADRAARSKIQQHGKTRPLYRVVRAFARIAFRAYYEQLITSRLYRRIWQTRRQIRYREARSRLR